MAEKGLLNKVLALVEGMAYLFGLKLKIVLDEHTIHLSFVKPKDVGYVAYDSNHYSNGNIFLRGKSSPLKPYFDASRKRIKMIGSIRYRRLMKLKVIGDFIKSQEDVGWTTRKIMLVGIILTAINTGAIGIFIIMLTGGI